MGEGWGPPCAHFSLQSFCFQLWISPLASFVLGVPKSGASQVQLSETKPLVSYLGGRESGLLLWRAGAEPWISIRSKHRLSSPLCVYPSSPPLFSAVSAASTCGILTQVWKITSPLFMSSPRWPLTLQLPPLCQINHRSENALPALERGLPEGRDFCLLCSLLCLQGQGQCLVLNTYLPY